MDGFNFCYLIFEASGCSDFPFHLESNMGYTNNVYNND